ncbi:hypothetical protein HYPBUDRAFT_113925 [Hyphopichia burtonii NRRL Y-1933]|uniref:Uncharacterized protein n=1 Tax=Hyphopichia burtonii NRRL Y-1933 TaxID=984485 RepID=A0A1E4RDZ0_9ASCO|nr:hypothetical protein HYPBUDRAFT_113925 [Hyphopichia burtonii NRRL Y-1933]ODV65461.1 hypothetical protein HYPBUDRAFT_113925 [Hyphopichia burtonii NRRL Y-1933]
MFRASIVCIRKKRFEEDVLTGCQNLSVRRFSVASRRNNLISDLYVSQIKQFKPTPISTEQQEASVKAFHLPQKPSLPSEEVSADGLASYESAEVETESAAPVEGSAPVEEDWFVFEEPEEHH